MDKKEFSQELWQRFKLDLKSDRALYDAYRRTFKIFNEICWHGFSSTPLYEFYSDRIRRRETDVEVMGRMIDRFVTQKFHLLCFEKCGRKILAPTPEVAEMLSNTHANVPIGYVRPPFDSVYFRLPEGVLQDRSALTGEMQDITAIFVVSTPVQEWVRELRSKGNLYCDLISKKWLTKPFDKRTDHRPDEDWFMKVFWSSGSDIENETYSYFDVAWSLKDDTCADDLYKKYMGHMDNAEDGFVSEYYGMSKEKYDEYVDVRDRIFRLVSNVFIYLAQPKDKRDIEIRRGPIGEELLLTRRKQDRRELLARWEASLEAEEIIIGQNSSIKLGQQKGLKVVENARGTPKTHWRRGHWHNYWEGPRSDRRLVPHWVMPTLVCGEGEVPTRATFSIDI